MSELTHPKGSSAEFIEGYDYWYSEHDPDQNENPYDLDSVQCNDWSNGFFFAAEQFANRHLVDDTNVDTSGDDEEDDEDADD